MAEDHSTNHVDRRIGKRRRGKPKATHGQAGAGKQSPEYRSWAAMNSRCSNSGDTSYRNYGARGITVCHRWRDSFEAFLADMGSRPTPKHSIDRFPNVNGGYWCGHCDECVAAERPANCRWASVVEQHNNRRDNRLVEWQGRTMTVADWARELGISYPALLQRIQKGWEIQRAMTERVHRGGRKRRQLP